MAEVLVDLLISADEYSKQYRVPGAVVTTRSHDSRNVRFPANILQPYITHTGIAGRFRICFDEQGKFKSIERLTVETKAQH